MEPLRKRSPAAADLGWLGVILLLGLFTRLHLLVCSGFIIDSDEAIVGLMARHILQGKSWPVFYYGQDYMGSFEAFIAAILFLLFGQSNAVLKLVPLLFSLFHIVLVYVLAAFFTTRAFALLAALFAALGPSALLHWSIMARGGFIELVSLGSLSLVVAVRILTHGSATPRHLFFLGLVLGLGWWVNNQIIFYMVPIAVVFLCHFASGYELRKSIRLGLYAVCGFFLGGLPFWYANIFGSTRWGTFKVLFGNNAGSDTLKHLEGFFFKAMPIILGSRRFWSESDVFPYASLTALYVYAIVLLVLCARCLNNAADKLQELQLPLWLLMLFCITTPVIFSVSSFGWLAQAPRYLLPFYSVLYVLVAAALCDLWSMAKVGLRCLVVVLCGLLFGLHLASCYLGGVAIPGQPMVYAGERVSKDHVPLYAWLYANGYRHIWTNYWIGYRTAFETAEQITFTRFGRPRTLRIPEYERASTGQPLVYVLVPAEASAFGKQLSEFGYAYRSSPVGSYVVIDGLERDWKTGRPVPPEKFKILASSRQDWAPYMVDNDVKTRWGSGMPQHPGMAVELVFNTAVSITGIDLDLGSFYHDAPRHMVIEAVLEDGTVKQLFDLAGTKIYYDLREQEFAEVPARWEILLNPVRMQKLRLRQLGETKVFDWSIAELVLYEPGEEPS